MVMYLLPLGSVRAEPPQGQQRAFALTEVVGRILCVRCRSGMSINGHIYPTKCSSKKTDIAKRVLPVSYQHLLVVYAFAAACCAEQTLQLLYQTQNRYSVLVVAPCHVSETKQTHHPK